MEVENEEKPINIRRATEADAVALIEYLDTISGESDYLTFGTNELVRSVQEEKEFITRAIEKENALFIIAEVYGKVVGNLNFSGGPRPRIAHVGEFGVSVLKEYWGRGIGEKLIKHLINWSCASNIIRKINLRVRTDNARGIYLYKKLGFKEEGLVKRDLLIEGKFYDSLLMGRIIN